MFAQILDVRYNPQVMSQQERLGPEQILASYIHQLGLQWRVVLTVDPARDRLSIVSRKDGQEHRIFFPPGHTEAFRCDLVHELIHAKFAEAIDPIFSSIYFQRSADINDPVFRQKAQMVYYAQMPVEVWVADYMNRVDRNLTTEDVTTWLRAIDQIPGPELRRFAAETVIGYAVNYAQIRRTGIKGYDRQENRVLQKMQAFLGRKAEQIGRQLGRYYRELPLLPMNATQAIPIFEQATQETAKIVGFPIKPSLVQEEDHWVWKIEDIME